MAATYSFAPEPAPGSNRPSPQAYGVVGGRRSATGVLTITGTYTTTGDVVNVLSQVHQQRLTNIEFLDAVTTDGFVPRWDATTGKLQLLKTGSATGNPLQEVANGATLNGTIRVVLIGI